LKPLIADVASLGNTDDHGYSIKFKSVRIHPAGEAVEIRSISQTSAFAFFALFVANLIAEFWLIPSLGSQNTKKPVHGPASCCANSAG
jgi:hypothetical protein